MTILGMHAQFDLEVDRISSGNHPDFNKREKDDYINKAIWILVKEHYDRESQLDLFYDIARKKINLSKLKEFKVIGNKLRKNQLYS